MHRLHRQTILTLCALLLLGAQQTAYSHFIGHLGLAGAAAAQPADASGDAVALGLSHLCTGCLAINALAAGAPLPVSLPAVVAAVTGFPVGSELDHPSSAAAPPYAARAPPYSL